MKNRVLLSTLEIKSVDEEKRILEGIASTPTPDSYNDVVSADGIEYTLPMPFLNQHRASEPIGNVIAAKQTKDGLQIKVQIAADSVAPYIGTAWSLIKAGLVRGLSIGFKALEESYDRERGGYNILRSKLYEVSAVTIPANGDCSITAIKSADAEVRRTINTAAPVRPVVRLHSKNYRNLGEAKSSVPADKRKKGVAYL